MEGQPNKFLQETVFCDCNNEIIKEIATRYRLDYLDDKLVAIKLFEFVRDNIKYRVGSWDKKASETLNSGYGMCTSSANLLVALLRAAGIPAGYCIYKVLGGDSFGGLLPDYLKTSVSKVSVHIISYVYLGKWIKCDSSTDKELSTQSSHISPVSKLIEWDGEHDAVHEMPKRTILKVSEPLDNIDEQLRKRPRFIVRHFLFEIGNDYINFLRVHGREFNDVEQLSSHFKAWMIKNKSSKFYEFLFIRGAYTFFEKINLNIKQLWSRKATKS